LLRAKASEIVGLSVTLPCFVKHLIRLISERRWRKCIKICKEIEFNVSHIFCEGNHCADKLASLGLENKLDFKWYDDLSAVIKLDFFSINSLCFVLFNLIGKYLPSFLAMGLA